MVHEKGDIQWDWGGKTSDKYSKTVAKGTKEENNCTTGCLSSLDDRSTSVGINCGAIKKINLG